MYKKIVSGLLTLCLVAGGAVGLSAVGGPAEGSVITASAEEYLTYGDYEYTLLSDGTVEIISYIGDDTAVNIPSKLNGKTVTSIGEYAFSARMELTSIEIPITVTNIGDYVFNFCYELTSITIPNGVTNIGDSCFYGCTKLTSISVDKNNKNYTSVDGVLFNKDKTVLIAYPIGKTNTSYSIPSSVKTVGADAFWDADNLTNVTIPNGVTSIGGGAFRSCSNLKSMKIPDSVTVIGDNAFCFCSALTGVTLSSNITDIDLMTFYACESLKSIVIPNGVKSIGWGAFGGCSSLTSVTIPDSVTSIEEYAFTDCTSLKSLTIPKSVTRIGYGDLVFGVWDYDKNVNSYDNFKINCYLGSAAETYAKENGISYKLLDHTHTYKTKVVKPTTSSKGYTLKTCSSCGDEIKSNYTAKLIAMSKCKASIAKSSYAYTGKAIKPTVTVKYGSTKLKKGIDYTVSYKNNTKTGKATITIKGKGKYTGTITKTFNIVPKKATLSKVTSPKTKTVKVTWKKDSQATGYQIVYSTSSKFKSSKSVTVTKNSTTSKTISKLTKGKTYYVKVRSYKTIGGKKVYGAYSTVNKVKCK